MTADSAASTGGLGEMAPIRDSDESGDVVRYRDGNAWDSGHDSPARRRRYRMTTELAVLDGDFFVLNDAGEHVYRFSSQSIVKDDKIRIEDIRGRFLYEASAHSALKQARIAICDASGAEIAAVLRRQVSPLLDKFAVELSDGRTLSVDGNVSTHEFSIASPRESVAEISRRWFRARGSYGVEILPEHRDALWLTTVVILDQMVGSTK
jgi:uncharacterized protein YxjI